MGLAHMGDIEKPRRTTRTIMLGNDPGRILDRHLVASEGHDTGAQFGMQIVEGGAMKRLRESSHSNPGSDMMSETRHEPGPAPSVGEPERFHPCRSDTWAWLLR